jgi:hypothetical protein
LPAEQATTVQDEARYAVVLVCVLALLLMSLPALAAPEAPAAARKGEGQGQKIEPLTYRPGEVIVIWKDGIGPVVKDSIKASVGVERTVKKTGSSR